MQQSEVEASLLQVLALYLCTRFTMLCCMKSSSYKIQPTLTRVHKLHGAQTSTRQVNGFKFRSQTRNTGKASKLLEIPSLEVM